MYTCVFCGTQSEGSGRSCPGCGAPVDVTVKANNSGWVQLPPIRDMARIQIGRSAVQIEGALVPAADFDLGEGEGVYFGHHELLWKDPPVGLTMMSLRGGWKRMRAGMDVHMLTAQGPGHVSISRDHPGEMLAIPIHPARSIDVREHLFMAATTTVTYDWLDSHVWYQTREGSETETHYPMGRYLDRFSAPQNPGLLLIHTHGNAFVRQLGPQESILVKPTAIVYKDTTVRLQLHLEHPRGTFRSWRTWGDRYLWTRVWGPGRLAVQSAFEPVEDEGHRIVGMSNATMHRW
ncbi:MAG TPA: AIM24 family protein [Candidatus Dormibacteraeota bacterium]|nr:AIM24 family protein [Candidatus Dormibacteraeota bacterium]